MCKNERRRKSNKYDELIYEKKERKIDKEIK